MRPNALLGLSLLLGTYGGALAAPSAEPAAPATQPAADSSKLIAQLGDDDIHVRQDATRKLMAMGKDAIPVLKQALKSADPEVHARAEELLQEIDQPVVLDEPLPQPTSHNSQSVSMSFGNGVKTVTVKEPGRTTFIEESPTGIVMKVTGAIDDKEVTREYKARNPDRLKHDHPAAFALYQQFAGGMNINGGIGGGRFVIRQNIQVNGQAVQIRPAPAPAPQGPMLGVSVADETEPGKGLVVTHVVAESRAVKIGLKEQDAIVKVNGQDIHSAADLRKQIAEHAKGLVVEVMRDGKPMKLEEKAE